MKKGKKGGVEERLDGKKQEGDITTKGDSGGRYILSTLHRLCIKDLAG